jgi:hypothetical protein
MSGGGACRRASVFVLVAAAVIVAGCRAAGPAPVHPVSASVTTEGIGATGAASGGTVATPSAEVTKPVPVTAKPGAAPKPKPAPRFVSVGIPRVCKQAAREQTSTVWTVYAPGVLPRGFERVLAQYSKGLGTDRLVQIAYRKGSAVIVFVEGQWTALGPDYDYHGTADWGTHQGRYADVAQFGWDIAGASARKPGTAVVYRGGKLLADYALYAQHVSEDDLREVAASMRVVK